MRCHKPAIPTLATILLAAYSSVAAAPTPNPVVNGAQSVVSPRGDLIAFLSNRAGADDVYVIGVTGHGEKQLTHTPETETGLQWSADGKEIVFSVLTEETSHIYAIDPKGTHLRELGAVTGRTPMLAPDGAHVLAMAGTWTATQLMVSALDGSNAQAITDGSSIAWNNHWSPDGTRIAFTGRNQPDGELAVFVMNADGTKRFQVAEIPPKEGGAQWPVWSPNGVNLAVQVNSRLEKGSAQIWLVNVASGDGSKLAAHDRAYLDETPSWFPDGKHLAFQSNRTGRMEVWVMKSDGTGARQVTGL
jgi:TolB protein